MELETETTRKGFLLFYIFECFIKIICYTAITPPNGYFLDKLNTFDFIIILISTLTVFVLPDIGFSLSFLRIIRILNHI